MGIYVKGMTMMMMASECRECELIRYYSVSGNTKCIPTGKLLADNYKPIPFDGKPEWCPLVELPEKHGRLVEFIDVATETDEDTGLEEVNIGEVFEAYFKMRKAKAVIEAEGE